jgi:hypothetical protein
MKTRLRLIVLLAALNALSVVNACNKPATPGVDPLLAVHQDAKTAIDALNAVSVISVTALNVAKAIPNVSPAAITNITNAVRAYNCALLDDGNPAPMPPPATGTVSDSCHSHRNSMLGIISKIQAAGSATTLHALALQGLAIAKQALDAVAATANADLLKYVTVAQAALAVIASWQ